MMLLATLLLLAAQDGLEVREFIYEQAPFPQCHASTLEETGAGLIAAWFGGTREGHDDVSIWTARYDGKAWSAPVKVAEGTEDGGERHPCWNPVLFQPKSGPLLLFYKVGPKPHSWWGRVMESKDGGKTWSKSRRLPDSIFGPIRSKPVQLADGTIVSGSSTEHEGWRVHFERSTDGGKTWTSTGPIHSGKTFSAIQPTILLHPGDRLQALCRSRQRKVVETGSADGGRTWSAPKATALPNPNSGFDAVTLRDGRHLLIYNHVPKGRSPLNLGVSEDGKIWKAALVLENEPGEYSYPAIIQTSDGKVHATYTWKRRRVRHVVIDPAKLALREFVDGAWPK